MSNPLLPLGTKLKRQNPSTLAWEDVPQVISMGFPGATQEYDDITNLDSPAGFRERMATVKAPRDMNVELLMNPAIAMHNTIIDDTLQNPVPLRKWRTVFPNGTDGYEFDAFPGSPDGSITAVAALRATLVLGVTGAFTRLS